jgi:CRISPR-associated protein Cas2
VLLWLIYDISDNALRTKTSEACKNHGLYRLQKSAFFGELEQYGLEALTGEVKDILNDMDYWNENDSVFILPVCKSCIQKRIVIGKEFDIEQYTEHDYVIVD